MMLNEMKNSRSSDLLPMFHDCFYCFALSVVFEFDSSAITLQQYCTGPPCSSD